MVSTACLFSPPTVFCATMQGYVHAFDYSTGIEVWKVALPLNPGNPVSVVSVTGRMALLGNTLYVGATNDLMSAIDIGSGQVQYTYDAQNSIANGLSILDDRVYFGAGPYLHSIFAANGTQSFKFKADNKISTRPLVEDKVFFGDEGGNVYGVEIY